MRRYGILTAFWVHSCTSKNNWADQTNFRSQKIMPHTLAAIFAFPWRLSSGLSLGIMLINTVDNTCKTSIHCYKIYNKTCKLTSADSVLWIYIFMNILIFLNILIFFNKTPVPWMPTHSIFSCMHYLLCTCLPDQSCWGLRMEGATSLIGPSLSVSAPNTNCW